jgi:hypothetical protein
MKMAIDRSIMLRFRFNVLPDWKLFSTSLIGNLPDWKLLLLSFANTILAYLEGVI